MGKRRTDATRYAYVETGALPEAALDWLDDFAKLAKRFPKASDLRVSFDGQGNVHAYIGEEEIRGLRLSSADGRFFGED